MTADHDIETAAMVLAKCAANDLWFPKGGDAVIQAWAEVFVKSGLTRDDLIAGVTRAYDTEDTGYRPLPASIVKHARAAYFEALRELPDERRELMEEANHVLQDMGFDPPEAHRFARQAALGRKPELQLTDSQLHDFQTRIAQRQALTNDPHKIINPTKFSRNFAGQG